MAIINVKDNIIPIQLEDIPRFELDTGNNYPLGNSIYMLSKELLLNKENYYQNLANEITCNSFRTGGRDVGWWNQTYNNYQATIYSCMGNSWNACKAYS